VQCYEFRRFRHQPTPVPMIPGRSRRLHAQVPHAQVPHA
jgi:hypothetical protein